MAGKTLAALCLLAWALALPLAGAQESAGLEETRGELRQRLSQLSDQQAQLTRALEETRRDVRRIETALPQLAARIKELARQEKKTSAELEGAGAQATEVASQVTAERVLWHEHLRAMYLHGAEASLWLLTSAENFRQAMGRSQNLTWLLEADRQRLAGLHKRRNELIALKTNLAYRRNELLEVRADFLTERARLTRLRQEQAALARDLEKRLKVLAVTVAAVKEAQGRLARTFALAAKDQPRPGVTAARGHLSPPVEGRVVKRSGPGRRGVVVAARPGAPVRAPWSGKVVYAAPLPGYGQVVVLDHGERLHTVLAFLGSMSVEQGRLVQAGAVVGAVDVDGRLYLEVRRGTRPVNPLAWLRLKP